MYDRKRFKIYCTYICDNVIHILLLLLFCYIIWIPISQYRQLLSLHAIFATIAFLLLMSESIILLSNNLWYNKLERRTKIYIHGIVFSVATFFAIIAGWFEYHRKATKKGHGHFNTIHGISGLSAIIITVLSCLGGLAAANTEWLQTRIFHLRPVVLKICHNIIGQVAYAIGMFSLCCAFYSHWIQSRTTSEERVVLAILTGFVTLWTLTNAVKSLYHLFHSLSV